jgi:uncharacterized protein (TIGR03790 family)
MEATIIWPLALLLTKLALAGGGPLNVMVIYNGESVDSEAVAQAYKQARALPERHICPVVGLQAAEREISFTRYLETIRPAVGACLDDLPQPEDIDYLVTTRGLPYRVTLDSGFTVSLSALLQVHQAADSEGAPLAGSAHKISDSRHVASVKNPEYIGRVGNDCDFELSNVSQGWYTAACDVLVTGELPLAFRRSAVNNGFGYNFRDNLFIVTRLDGFDFEDALDLVERGVAADSSYPEETILCMEGADSARAARDPECELVTRNLAKAGFNAEYLSPHDPSLKDRDVAAYFTGADQIRNGIDGLYYAPGAVTGNLTSFGAHPDNFFCSDDGVTCPESEWQTSIARWIRAGATGAHGTVNEPMNSTFPNAGSLLLYTFGYSLGESWFYNQKYLYWQNLYLGDPLTMPYGDRPTILFEGQAMVQEGSPLIIRAEHPFGIREIELYDNGVRIAHASAALLVYEHERLDGEKMVLLAVATAKSKKQARAGWPVEILKNRSRPKGWASESLLVTPAPDPPPLFEEGCGCRTPGLDRSLLTPLLLVSFGLARRERQGMLS